MKVVNKKGNDTHLLLLPLPRGTRSGYESFSSEFRKKIIKILNVKNIYELSSANKSGLIVDHKFPEIRWDEKTKSENIESISEDEIKKRFQLLDNQRNQQKREKCRECFQTNKRGILFGINYYYEGDENWEQDIPKMGKDAERGCVGCGWYDVEKWRNELNNLLKNYKC